jgi:lactoylglutathione lyase
MTINHVAFWVRDLERMKEFYEKYFGAVSGLLYENRKKHFRSYFLAFSSGCRLELMEKEGITTKLFSPGEEFWGYGHLALSAGTEDAVVNLTAFLETQGVQVLSAPRWTGDGYFESVIVDPEGNVVELTV